MGRSALGALRGVRIPSPADDPTSTHARFGVGVSRPWGGVIPIPLPLLVLPWLLAIGTWLAFPWLAGRIGHAGTLRWVPPGLVVVGGAMLWLSAEPADGHDARASAYASAHAALCDAEAALPGDREAAVAAFVNRAHDTLHTIAADPMLDRGLAADLLRAKQAVESEVAADASGDALAEPMTALVAATTDALADLEVEVSPCAG